MTSLAVQLDAQGRAVTYTSGPGWTAEIGVGYIDIHTSPEGDALPAAVRVLLSVTQQRLWSFEPAGEDDHGWDLWRGLRDGLRDS